MLSLRPFDLKILHLAHNHPAFHAGGTEIFAKELSAELEKRPGVSSTFLAAALKQHRRPHPGTSFAMEQEHPADFVITGGHFTPVSLSQSDTFGFLNELARLLSDLKPDIVHIHHILLFGIETFAVIRNAVPHAKIVMTLHDYYLICANDGLMRTTQGRLCEAASPTKCSRCLSSETEVTMALREQTVRTALRVVDEFVAPSEFLKSVFVKWGLKADKIRVIHNGYPLSTVETQAPDNVSPSYDFGFFGHLNEAKGAKVFLEACQRLQDQNLGAVSAAVYGSDRFASDAQKEELAELKAALKGKVSFFGDYDRRNVVRLMQTVRWVVVPSVWWENDPLIVQEAKIARRPILCSDIGGMAERVVPGKDGFHFRSGDAGALANLIQEIVSGSRSLEKTEDTSTAMPGCVEAYKEVYRDVLNDRP